MPYSGYLARRILQALLLLLAVSAATFVFVDLAPGDPLDALRLDPQMQQETLEVLRARHGLDDPLPVRYLRWLGGLVRGDLGVSVAHGVPVWQLLRPRLGATLLLGAASTLLTWLLAMSLGSLAALRPGGWLDRAVSALEALLLSLPELLLALLALFLAAEVPWLPIGGMGSGADLLRHLLLPTLVLAAAGLAGLVSHVRAEVRRAASSPAVLAARGHGLGGVRLFCGYLLPEAANPLISLFGLSVGALLSGSLVVEAVFSWPGLGPLVLASIRERDLAVLAASILASSVLLVAGQLLADVWLTLHDPRVRTHASDAGPEGAR